MDVIYYIRGWIAIVALMAFGNTISCFRDHNFLADRLYTESTDYVNPLLARMFGVWTFLAALLRLYCAIHITNAEIYNLTLFSFVLAFAHFLIEVLIYKTATFSIGIIVPLIVSGVSIVVMCIGYGYHPAFTTDQPSSSSKRSKRSMKDELLTQKRR